MSPVVSVPKTFYISNMHNTFGMLSSHNQKVLSFQIVCCTFVDWTWDPCLKQACLLSCCLVDAELATTMYYLLVLK